MFGMTTRTHIKPESMENFNKVTNHQKKKKNVERIAMKTEY